MLKCSREAVSKKLIATCFDTPDSSCNNLLNGGQSSRTTHRADCYSAVRLSKEKAERLQKSREQSARGRVKCVTESEDNSRWWLQNDTTLTTDRENVGGWSALVKKRESELRLTNTTQKTSESKNPIVLGGRSENLLDQKTKRGRSGIKLTTNQSLASKQNSPIKQFNNFFFLKQPRKSHRGIQRVINLRQHVSTSSQQLFTLINNLKTEH